MQNIRRINRVLCKTHIGIGIQRCNTGASGVSKLRTTTIERNGSRVRAINQMENYRSSSIPHSVILSITIGQVPYIILSAVSSSVWK